MANVQLDGVTKRFGSAADAVVAVEDVTLHIDHHEFMVLVGPSGCGKSTLLRIIAGLEDPTEGDVIIGDRRVNDVLPKSRDVAMVFQSYALYPHKTIAANIEFPLKVRGVPRAERRAKALAVAESLGLDGLMDRRPAQLSGGQSQRVALARAIVREPAVFCMDEPLSNLDAKLRTETRAELVALHQRLDTTFVYVTHDQVEAMTMATRVAVMSQGRILQTGTPQEVYAQPTNAFVAGFLGTPPMNVLPAGVLEGADVRIGIRPEDAVLLNAADANSTAPGTTIEGSVRLVEQLGHETLVFIELPHHDGARVAVRRPASAGVPTVGDEVAIEVPVELRHRFDAVTGERIA